MKTETKAMMASAGAYTIFGLSYLFSKRAMEYAEPSVLLACRFAVTFLVLNIMASVKALAKKGALSLRRKPLWKVLMLGILQPILYFVLENYGLKYTTTTFTGVMSAISPVFTILLGVLLLHEKTTVKQNLFAAISIAGVLIISLMNTQGGTGTLTGCLCLMGAYTAGALYSIVSRSLSKDFTGFEITYVMFGMGFVFFAGMALVQYGTALPSQVAEAFSHTDFTVGVAYLGILSSVAAYLLINYSLAHLAVARASIFGNLATVVSVLSGIFIMGDAFSLRQGIASVLIIAGVWGVNQFKKQEEA